MQEILNYLSYNPARPLLFNTALYFVLFTVFFAIYRRLLGKHLLRLLFTIAFSLYFYYKTGGMCVLILFGLSIADFIMANVMYRLKSRQGRKLCVGINVAANIGMLAYFKYFNMLCGTFAAIFSVDFSPFDIILPAGISFFSFRSISYIVDVYRGQLKPCGNLLHYIFFLTFFPPILAGPVVRAKTLLPQIARDHRPTQIQIARALLLIAFGLLKKAVIADYISAGFVDRVFDNPTLYTGLENLIAAYGFTLQLYCDFSAYSDIAIGTALLLGYRFEPNFNSPLASQSPTEFWHRWHISLSTWLRDYLYIPLGGNRNGKWRAHLNLMITMTLGGLWHGASWMYIIWGAWNGLLLVLHKMWVKVFNVKKNEAVNPFRRVLNIVVTFSLMAFGFIFFRAESMADACDMIAQIFTTFHPEVFGQLIAGYPMVMTAILLGLVTHYIPSNVTNRMIYAYSRLSTVAKAVLLALVIFAIIQIGQADIVPFIYLQY